MTMGFIKEQNNTNDKLQIPCDFRHAIILGETGSGKTASVINPLLLDRIKKGHGILVFDFKGNYHYTVKALAKKENKLNHIIELGKIYGKYSNIIENLPVESVEKILRQILRHDEDNKFWEESAVQLALSILSIIYYMNELFENYKYSYSFKSLIEITSNAKNIREFKRETLNLVNKFLKRSFQDDPKLNLIDKILNQYKILDSIADDFSIDRIEDNEKTVLNSVISSLVNPISSLRKESINTNEINILNELNKGKIIIASLNDFEENVLNAIVSSIFYQIYHFKMDYPNSKITIIMDEAQKVLNDNFNLPLDVLREYKVEVILATQSIANLKEKLSNDKADALLANLVHKVFLNGQDEEVPKFQALYNQKYYNLIPLEIDNISKFQAEREYQKKYSKLKNMPFIYKGMPIIYSKFSDIKLIVKNSNFEVLGKVNFFLNRVKKYELYDKYQELLKIDNDLDNRFKKYTEYEEEIF